MRQPVVGMHLNACSLHQLQTFGSQFPGAEVGIRFNPGLGSGSTGKTNVGGPDASFGIWHESAARVHELALEYNLKIIRIHTHIGSGSDPAVWQRVAAMSIELVRQFKDVHTLNLGGGFKVARTKGEASTNLSIVGQPVRDAVTNFAHETGRKLALEIEPGTALLANAGAVVCTVQDRVHTSQRTFLKLDSGMTEILRPALYGAQHPLVVVSATDEKPATAAPAVERVVVVGHCCESGDLLSCAPGDAESIQERTLQRAEIGDIIVIEGAGAYCASMAASNYNSFPVAPEALLDEEHKLHVIRRRQPLEHIWQNEVRLESKIGRRLAASL